MRVALVHDWLTGMRGGERCLQSLLQIYPQADIFCLLHVPGKTSVQIDQKVRGASFLQQLPGVRHYYRALLPLYPLAAARLKLVDYDLVISLSHAAAKNVSVAPGVPHVCYCFTPMRYIWDQAEAYLGGTLPIAWPLIKYLRAWDRAGATNLRAIATISRFVSARVRAFYGLKSTVVFPPVDTSWIRPATPGKPGEAFLYAGALVPYKRPDLVISAFNQLGLPLWVVGTGPQEKSLRKFANSNIKFFGRVSDVELAEILARSRALILPGVEDFGLLPVEAMAAGRPVIGPAKGGLKETVLGVRPWTSQSDPANSPTTGVFMASDAKRPLEALVSSVYYFIDNEARFTVENCVEQSKLFSPQRFFQAWQQFISDTLSDIDTQTEFRDTSAVVNA